MSDMDLDDLLKLPPAPRKEDVVVRDDLPDWQSNACLNYMGSDDRYAYSEGYLRAARYLIEWILATASDQDILVYPIIFLYRHHIELVLKQCCPRHA